MTVHQTLFNFFFRPQIRHENPIREWKLNAFHQMLSTLLVAICVPMSLLFVLLHMPVMLAASGFAALSVFISLPIIRNGKLTPAVHLYEIVSLLMNLLFIHLLRLNDSAYFLFFNSLIAGVFLSFPAAMVWAGIFTINLLILPLLLPGLTLMPQLLPIGDHLSIVSHETHFSTAILFIWVGAFISILFNRYVTDLITSIIRKNDTLSSEIAVRVAAEKEAQASREFSDQIISGAGEGIVVFNGSHHCVVWNPAMERLTGLPPKSVRNASIGDVFSRLGLDKTLPLINQLGQGKTIQTEPYEFRTGKETDRSGWVMILLSPHRFQPDEPEGIVAMFRDVTEQQHLENALQQSQKLQAVGQLAGGIAHDFNNQLTSILGYAQLLQRHLSGQKKTGLWAEKIVVGVRRAGDLTQKLLTFASKGKCQNVTVDMHELMSEVITMLDHSIDKRITVTKDFSASSPWTSGDPTLLQNALLNLALNARDAMPGGGTLRFSTELRKKVDYPHIAEIMTDSSERFLALSVADTGSGIPPEIRPRIFEPFFTTKPPGKGTGMGLAAVYGTIRDHQGSINVDSETGKGSVVTIALPISPPPHPTKKKSTVKPPQSRTGTILLIDDEQAVLDYTKDALLEFGYQVVCAHDGVEGLALFSSGTFDCVIVDYMMPRKNGVETIKELLQIDPIVKVILCSGYGVQEKMFTSEEASLISFLQKPTPLETLLQTVNDLLKKNKSTS